MVEPAPPHDLLRALGKVSRGLSTLFWCLPIALVIFVKTATKLTIDLEPFDVVAPILICVFLFIGLHLMGSFRPHERVWHQALDRARIFNLLMLGLSPFVYFWARFSQQVFFGWCVIFLAVSSLCYLGSLNVVLQRLAAMLPDQTLRQEVMFFSKMNLLILLGMPAVILFYIAGRYSTLSPGWLISYLQRFEMFNPWLILFLFLLPMAMTMALIWKIREVVLHGIFGSDPH